MESAPGQGATFTVELPLARGGANPDRSGLEVLLAWAITALAGTLTG